MKTIFFISVLIKDGNWKLYLFDKKPDSLYPPLLVPALLGWSLWLDATYILVKNLPNFKHKAASH
jgi:hypothetical protein